jgi:hypothetical protein
MAINPPHALQGLCGVQRDGKRVRDLPITLDKLL